MNKPKYLNLGTMMKAKKKDANNPDEAPRFYIKLEQPKGKDKKPYGDQIFPITLANGVVLNDGDMLSMFSMREKLNKKVEAGYITEDQANNLASFLIFEICAVIRNEGGGNAAGSDDVPF